MYLHVPLLFPMLLVPLELPRKTAFLWHSQACINRDCRCHKQFPARWVRLKYVIDGIHSTGTFYKKEHKVTPTIYLNWNSFFFHRLCLRLLRRGYQIISMQIFVVCNQIGITQGEKVWNIGDSFNVANSCQSKVGQDVNVLDYPNPHPLFIRWNFKTMCVWGRWELNFVGNYRSKPGS